jgi:hypothetical protein
MFSDEGQQKSLRKRKRKSGEKNKLIELLATMLTASTVTK